MKRLLVCTLLFSFCVLITIASQAASLDAYCFYPIGAKDPAVGKDLAQLLPLASVSKVLTSHWALVERGPNYRFPTQIFLRPVMDGRWDIHLAGSRDPYFGKENLHYIISELNKMNITKIRNFTIDEKVKLYWDVRRGFFTSTAQALNSPTWQTVLSILRQHSPFLSGYAASRAELKKVGVELVAKPTFTVEKISAMPSSQYNSLFRSDLMSLATGITRTFYSAPLVELVKEMNRNSNNNAANQIFQSLGGPNAYRAFIQRRFGFGPMQIALVNGSGAPFVENGETTPLFVNGQKLYNRATCSSVLSIMNHLYRVAKFYKFSFEDIFAVPGENNSNTLDGVYGTDALDGVLMAKTGTIDPTISLAGLASTKKGDVLFYYNMDINGNSAGQIARDQRSARYMIRDKVTELIQMRFGGGRPVEIERYAGTSFHFGFSSKAVAEIPALLRNPWNNVQAPILLRPIMR